MAGIESEVGVPGPEMYPPAANEFKGGVFPAKSIPDNTTFPWIFFPVAFGVLPNPKTNALF